MQCDETYVRGLERNKHADRKLHSGRGTVGKTPVVGVRDEDPGRVWVEVIRTVNGVPLREFLNRLALPGAKVVTDQHAGYNGLTGRTYVSVNHSLGQYVDDHGNTTNGIESLWAQLKRWLRGTYHQVSVKHLPRYLRELMWRHNHRNSPVLDQMGAVVRNMDGRRLRLRDMRSGGRFVTAMTVELGKFLPLQRELFQLAA